MTSESSRNIIDKIHNICRKIQKYCTVQWDDICLPMYGKYDDVSYDIKMMYMNMRIRERLFMARLMNRSYYKISAYEANKYFACKKLYQKLLNDTIKNYDIPVTLEVCGCEVNIIHNLDKEKIVDQNLINSKWWDDYNKEYNSINKDEFL